MLSVTMMAQSDLTYMDPDSENLYFTLSGEADKAIAEGEYAVAIEHLKEAISINPDNPANVLLLSNLGMVYNYVDQDSLALEAFDRAINIAPSMTVVLVNRGKLYLKMGDDDAAFEDFGKVVERDSTNVDALFYHGIIALYNGHLQDAERDLSYLKEAAPDSHNTAIALATLYSMTGFEERAITYYQKLIDEDAQPEYYAGLAGCLISTDRLSEASALLNEAMDKYHDNPELYMYRALLNKKRYLNKAAREDARKAISLGADPRRVHLMMKN